MSTSPGRVCTVDGEEDDDPVDPPVCVTAVTALVAEDTALDAEEETEFVIDLIVSGTSVHAMAVKMPPRRRSRIVPFTLNSLEVSSLSCAI